jgi:hypothetical protein
MSFTTPEFPGRTFSSIDDMNKAVKEKKQLQRELENDIVVTTVERIKRRPHNTS